jgi:hypothetical protein
MADVIYDNKVQFERIKAYLIQGEMLGAVFSGLRVYSL